MSYTVSIRRTPENPLTESEIRALVDGDPTLSLDSTAGVPGELILRWQADPHSESVGFLFSDGCLDTAAAPSNASLRRMQSWAAALDARLVGEEGQDLTEIDVPSAEVGTGTACGCLLAAAGLVAAGVWWLFIA